LAEKEEGLIEEFSILLNAYEPRGQPKNFPGRGITQAWFPPAKSLRASHDVPDSQLQEFLEAIGCVLRE
jgi:hypothetical protein